MLALRLNKEETQVTITPSDISLDNVVVLEDFKQEKIPLVIYFASDLLGLVAEKIEVVKVEGLAKKVFVFVS
ncbi:hypothetical protein M1N67_02095 [Peptococcaceae bacterium]|nr:hypothetical protein [Peptococcaceae bacterium]